MSKPSLFVAILVAAATTAPASAASQAEFGTPEEAVAMLERAISALTKEGVDAITRFNHNEVPFRDRDLFVFCFDRQAGVFTAHEAMVGRNIHEFRDQAGQPLYEEMARAASEGEVREVSFLAPVPGTTRKAMRLAYVTALGDQICGVSAFRASGAAATK